MPIGPERSEGLPIEKGTSMPGSALGAPPLDNYKAAPKHVVFLFQSSILRVMKIADIGSEKKGLTPTRLFSCTVAGQSP